MKDLSVVSYVKREIKKYPFIETMDIYKMLYQSVYLTGHLVNNKLNKVKDYLVNESKQLVKYNNGLLYEYISNDVVRINLKEYLEFDELEKLFDKYSKFDDSLNSGDASGLELSITKNLVELLGGRIIVQTAQGAGSHGYHRGDPAVRRGIR